MRHPRCIVMPPAQTKIYRSKLTTPSGRCGRKTNQEVRCRMLKKRIWLSALVIIVVAGAASFFGRNSVSVVQAQNAINGGPALPGGGGQAYMSPATEVIVANLPVVRGAGGG